MTSITKIAPVEWTLAGSALDITHEVFGDNPCVPIEVQKLIRSYFTFEEVILLSDENVPFHKRFRTLSPFPQFINFTDIKTLKPYVQDKYQGESYLSLIAEIAKKIYETPIIPIGEGSPYGAMFPMYPEILAYALRLYHTDVVLEIAGAHGVNALFFAFTKTIKVIVNDIDDSLLEKFRTFKGLLPHDVSRKLECICKNCFQLLKARPDLKKAVDLVLCRNLIHYFSDQEHARFFALLSKVLKVGGRAILTANSKYSLPHVQSTFASNPEATCFTVVHCVVANNVTLAHTFICKEAIVCPNHLFSMEESEFILYDKPLGSNWTVNKEQYDQLASKIRSVIKKACDSHKQLITSMTKGFVKVFICMRRIFSEITFSQLIHKHGFEVEHTFLTQKNGHLADKELYGDGHQQIGIVCKKVKV
jgi:SAM-dependent methyltransferase